MGGTDLLKELLIEATFEGSTMLTFCAVFFEGAGIAASRIGSIHLRPFCIAMLFETQEGTLWAYIDVLLRIILELVLSIEWRAVVKVRQGYIGVDVLVCKRHDVVDGSIGRVSRHLTRPEFPPKTHTPQQI